MDANKLVTVIFTEVSGGQFTLSATPVGSGTIAFNPPGGVYDAGTVVTLTATPASGGDFLGWSGDLSGTSNPATITLDANKSVTGTFSEVTAEQFTLTMNTTGTGSVILNPAGGVYDAGTVVTVTAVAGVDFEFTGWSGDLSGNTSPTTITMDGNKTVNAAFTEIVSQQFTLSSNVAGTGSISLNPAGGSYDAGTVVTVTAVPGVGFEFSGWSGDLTGLTNPTTITMDGNKTIAATFNEVVGGQFTLTMNNVGTGSVTLSPAGGVYNAGTVVTLTPAPGAGFEFSGWSGDLTGAANPTTITMDANKIVTATFTEIAAQQFALTPTVSGSGTITLNPAGGIYDAGTVVTLTANANSGNTFNGWSGDLSGSVNPTTITMDANKAVTANFISTGGGGGGGPVVHEETVSGGASLGTVASTSTPITMVSGHLYLASISTKNPRDVVSVSGLGLNWSRVKAQCTGRGQTAMEVWMAIGNPSGDGIVTATVDNANDNIVIAVSRYSGVDAGNPIGDIIGGNTLGLNGACSGGVDNMAYSFNVTTSTSDAMIFGAIAHRNRHNTPGAGYSEHDEYQQNGTTGGSVAGMSLQDRSVASPSTVPFDGTLNKNVDWAVVAFEIRSGGSGGGGTTQYSLTTNTVGSGTVSANPAGGTYDENTIVTLTAIPAAGFEFSGWSGDLSGSTNPASITMDANKSVTATFTEIQVVQYTLTTGLVGLGNVSLSPAGGVYDAGTVVTVTAVPAAGYQFAGFAGDLAGTVNPSTITMDDNKNVTVLFTEAPANQFTLSVTPAGSGTVALNPPGGVYDAGTVVTLTATPAAGFQFDGWSGDLSGNVTPTTITVDANKTVTAAFSEIPVQQFTITANTVGTGTVTLNPTGGVYDAGTVVTLTAVPGAGFEFSGWVGDLTGTINPATVTVDANKIVTATFTEVVAQQFTLTANTSGSGTITLNPAGGVYDAGTVVTVTAAANAGNSFDGWSGDLSGNTNPTTITMDANKSITASFISTGGGGGGPVVREETVSGGGSLGTVASTSTPISMVNDHLYLASISTKNPRDVVSVTGLGLSWSRVRAQCTARGQTAMEVWMAIGNPSGDGIVTATVNTANDNIVIAVSRYSGVDTGNPVGSIIGGNTLGLSGACSGGTDNAAYSFNVTTSTADAVVFGAIAHRNRRNTPGAGYTEFGEFEQNGTTGGSVAGMSLQDRSVASPSTVPFDGTMNKDVDWAVVAFEIRSGGSSGGGGTTQFNLSTNTVGSGTVSANPAGGTYDENTVVTLTATPAAGFEFSGWSGDLSGSSNPATVTMSSNRSVTATFTEIQVTQYSLTTGLVGLGNVTLDPAGGTYDEGTVVTVTAVPSIGYVFSGFAGDLSGTTNPATITMDDNKSITALFTEAPANQFTLTVTPVGSGTVSLNPPGGVYDDGTIVTVTASPASGSQFDGWSGDLTGSTNPTTITVDGNKNVTATFSEIPSVQYTLNTGLIGLGSITLNPAGGTYDEGTEVTITAVPASGYIFVGFAGDVGGNTNPSTVTMDGNKNVTVIFTEAPSSQFTLTTNTSGSGSISASPSGGAYDDGTVVTLTATPDAGFEFSGWSGDLSGSTNPATITMDANKTVTATFTEIPSVQYNLTAGLIGLGTIEFDPAGGVYNEGTVVTVTAVPAAGYIFVGFAGDLGGTTNPATVTMDGNKNITIIFTESSVQQFTLTSNVSGSGSVSLSPAGGTYDAGTVVTVTATADAGNQFDGWSGDLSGTTNPATITMNSNKTITAGFISTGGGGGGGQVVYEGTVSGGATEMNSVTTASNVTAVSGDLYLASIVTKNLTDVLAVDGLGLTWSLVRAQCSGRSNTGIEIWMAMGTPSGDGQVTATLASTPSNSIIAVSRYSGVDAVNPVGTILSGNSLGLNGACADGVDSDAYNFNFSTTAATSVVHGSIALRNRRHTPGVDYTERQEIVQDGALGGDKATLAIQDREVASPSTVSLDGTFNKTVDWAVVGIEIRSSGTTKMSFQPAGSGVVTAETRESLRGSDYGKTLPSHGGAGESGEAEEAGTISQYYWKFNVVGINNGLVEAATLRFYVENNTTETLSAYRVANKFEGSREDWQAADLTSANAPVINEAALSTAGTSVMTNGWVELDVTDAISVNGTYSFAVPASAGTKVVHLSATGDVQTELRLTVVEDSTASEEVKPFDIALIPDVAPQEAYQTGSLPDELMLGPNYPEPFNPETTLQYALPEAAKVRIEIFNVLGQRVRKLVDNQQTAGFKEAVWDGRNDFGNMVGSGVYFFRLKVGSQKLVGKMTLQK